MTRVIPRLVGQAGLRIGVCVYTAAGPHNHTDLCFLVQSRSTPASDSTCRLHVLSSQHWDDTFFDALGFYQIRTYLKFQC